MLASLRSVFCVGNSVVSDAEYSFGLGKHWGVNDLDDTLLGSALPQEESGG